MHLPNLTVLSGAVGLGLALALVAPMAPAAAATAKCGQKITHDFTLTNDLRNCPGHGLVVGAANITLDLNGHTLDGTGNEDSGGVWVHGFNGVTVKRGVIAGFGRGIWVVRSSDVTIRRNVISDSFEEGVFTNESSPGALIRRNTVRGSGIRSGATWADGIDARADDVKIRYNTVRNSRDDGIDANGAGVVVTSNTVTDNGYDGIDVDGHGTVVANNTATNNVDDGIGVGANASNVTVRDNTADHNDDLGIQATAGTVVDGGGNRASGNGDSRQCVQVECS